MTDFVEKREVHKLRQLADSALHEFGFREYHLQLVQHLVNTTFTLTCDTGRYLVRIHRIKDRTPLRINSELAWLESLSRDTSISVQTPHRSPNGKMIVVADAPGISESYPVTILSWLNGNVLSQERRFPHHFEQLGRLVAKLHNHSQYWTLPPEFDRPTYCADDVLRRVYCEQLPSNVRDDLLLLRERLLATEEQLGCEPERFGLIHFDLSFGNVLFTRKEGMPIDFEECGFGYYLFDLAVILAGPWQRPGFQDRFKSLIQGYRKIRKLDDDLLRLLPTFMAARAALLGQWQRIQMLLNLSYTAL